MAKSKKLPAIQFYPGDWRKDMGVQSLSYHDRGVWFEMLMLMHESEERGKLLLNGVPMDEQSIGRLLGLDKQILTTTITSLLNSGVASRDDKTGMLYSRRMVRDEKLRHIRSEAGKLGGNPVLLIQKNEPILDKQIPTPSSSVSSSTAKQVQKTKKAQAPFVLPEWIDRTVWDAFEEMRKRKRAPLTDHARELAVKDLIALEAKGYKAEDVLNQSIMKSWSGLFAPANGGTNGRAKPTRNDPTNGNAEVLREAVADTLRRAGGTGDSTHGLPDGFI